MAVAASRRAAAALEEARDRCASFFGDLEALAHRVRLDRDGVAELTEPQWDALDALDAAVACAVDLDVTVDDAVRSLLDEVGYEDSEDGGSAGTRSPAAENASLDDRLAEGQGTPGAAAGAGPFGHAGAGCVFVFGSENCGSGWSGAPSGGPLFGEAAANTAGGIFGRGGVFGASTGEGLLGGGAATGGGDIAGPADSTGGGMCRAHT